MSYTALYRRFRPQLFGDLVGQPHISRTLAAAVKKAGFVHAYLFCGPRGTGKTSTAKILARAVNCLDPALDGEPCGVCMACLRNTQGESLDILEIDAASNRGIDEIRELRDRVKYVPVLEKYKVYIIDEVHMLTGPAFNAFLKTLEEPPQHVIFILATTEPHKIPLTVLSRCQRFDFRRIADNEVEAHLQKVAEAEGYTFEQEALAKIARRVEGGLRDALSLLDQCASAFGGQITMEVLQMLTGAAGRDFIEMMTKHMCEGAIAELLSGVAELYSSGRDLRQFLHDLLEYQRELLLLKLSPTKQVVPPWADNVQPALLLKLLSALADCDARLRNSLQPRLTLELTLLSLCGIPEARGERTEDRGQQTVVSGQLSGKADDENVGGTEDSYVGSDAHVAPPLEAQEIEVKGQEAGDAPTNKPVSLIASPLDEPVLDEPVLDEPVTDEPVADDEDDLLRIQELWPAIVTAVIRVNNSTGAFLAAATPVSLEKDKLMLCFEAEYGLYMNSIVNSAKARKVVEQQIATLFGRNLSVGGVLAEAKEGNSDEGLFEADQGSLFG